MKRRYVDEQVETFLKKLWHRANEYQELADKEVVFELKYKYEKKCNRLRKFYNSVHFWYRAKQRENSGNYIFKK